MENDFKEPELALLISMAIRYNHSLILPKNNELLKATVSKMKQVYEEVSGHGFYSDSNKQYYLDIYNNNK